MLHVDAVHTRPTAGMHISVTHETHPPAVRVSRNIKVHTAMFNTLSFRNKLIAGSLVMVLTAMVSMLATSFVDTKRGYIRQGREALRNVSQILMESAQFQDTLNRNKIGSDLKLMQLQFGLSGFPIPEIFMEVETEIVHESTGEREKSVLPGFKLGAVYLNENTDLVDRIHDLAGVGASVLQLHQGKLVRVSTSVRNASGATDQWTYLPQSHQAVAATTAGTSVTGIYKIAGEWQLAMYAPIKGMEGTEILGAMEVARPLLSPEFAAAVVRHNVDGKGYSFAYDAQGIILIHPDKRLLGTNINGQPWASPLQQAGNSPEKAARSLTYVHDDAEYEAYADVYAPWGITFVTTVQREDLMAGVDKRLWTSAAVAAAVTLPLVALVIWLMVRQLMLPMRRLSTLAQEVAQGNFDYTFDYVPNDTIGTTVRAVKTMVGELKRRLGFSQGVLDGIVVPCAVVNLKNEITHVNAEALSVLRRSGAPWDYTGKPLGELLYGTANGSGTDRRTFTRRSMEQHARVAEDAVCDPQGDGREVVLHIVSTPIYDMDGELLGAISLWIDLTHERAQHARLDAQNAVIAATAREADEIARRVASSAQELSLQVSHASQGAARQLEHVREVTSAMEHMDSSVTEIGRKAGNAVELAKGSVQVAEAGRKVVQSSMEVMHRVHGQVTHMQNTVEELGRQAEGIGHIMGVISDIADQTNLLALNAAIEAARAGDAGRGFAVVADEVRKLAEKTMSATGQVGQRIRSIQESTRGFIESTASVARAVQESDNLTTRSGGALDDILSRIQQSESEICVIADMAQEQTRGVKSVSAAVTDVDGIARETAQAMAESADAVNILSRLAHELQHAMDGMAQENQADTQHAMQADPVSRRRAGTSAERHAEI